jgi:hypothetical protein
MEILKMKQKIYISYVIQANDKHSHHAEIIEIEAPHYSFSFASGTTTTNAIMKWKEQKWFHLTNIIFIKSLFLTDEDFPFFP